MTTFPYVEDYIEFIAGVRDRDGNIIKTPFMSQPSSVINLARYDVGFITNLTIQFLDNIALTTRQADLACKIILKYKKQLALRDINVVSVETPHYRFPLRQLDYSRRIYIENDTINIQFPYNTKLIDQLREFATISHGSCRWHKDKKVWQAALTEFNVNWIHTWAQTHEATQAFHVDQDFANLFEQITTIEKASYRICLNLDSDRIYIENCPTSLEQYILDRFTFDCDNLLTLADHSAILGYSLSESIADLIIKQFGVRFFNLISSREIKLNTISKDYKDELDSVFDYIDHVQRWPVVIYEPDYSEYMLNYLKSRYDPALIQSVQELGSVKNTDARYIHSTKPLTDISSIPVLITRTAFTFGGTRATMFQRAEKIVYSTVNIYNDRNTRVKDIAS